MPNRVIMHVDLDYFYAQCEENRKPDIRGKPVVVCVYSGRTEESGVVSTSNYLARKYGVKAGIPIARAKKLLESANSVFLPMDRPYYEQVSDSIMEILRGQGDAFEKVGIDEAYIEISTRANNKFEQTEDIAAEVKRQILADEQITCSIGIAPNKLVAKIASDERKPDGLTVVRPEDVNSFLTQLPASRIPGVGKRVEDKLDQMHVRTIAELSTLSPTSLVENFGKSLGGYLFRAARGEDDEPVKEREQPTQLSRIATLKRDSSDLPEILPLLSELANAVTAKLNEKGMMCRSVAIIAILNDLSIHTKSKTLEQPTADEKTIMKATHDLMKEFLDSIPVAMVRRTGVKLSTLSKPTGQTDIANFLKV
ncbi:MAG: DNA polymerase IV [Candidatus Bathyarchaeia archaeon]